MKKRTCCRCPTKTIAISLLVVASVISSLLLLSFHHETSLLQQRHDLQRNHQFGSPSADAFPNRTLTLQRKAEKETKISHAGTNRGCFSHMNSQSWLENKRFGNQNSSDSRIIDNEYIASSILNTTSLLSGIESNSQTLLRHTLCARTSRFLSLTFSSSLEESKAEAMMTANNSRIINHLSLRLMYLSVHVHQHMHAIEEAKVRLDHPPECELERKSRNIGKFDFECPNAKFLVVPMKHSGLGGQVRLIAASALMAGISTDRVVLFVNHSPVGPNFIREPWDLSSCLRRDKQCFFLPDSPCVLTHNEIQNATVLDKGQRRALFKTGELPANLKDKRVIVMNMKDRPQRTPLNFRARISDIARRYLINPLATENPVDPRLPLLSAAADRILQEDESTEDTFYYYGRNFQHHHAMVFYAMRPKAEFAERIDRIVYSTLGENHQTDLTLGLPIRASDKCDDESECPSFETYMLLMQNVLSTNKKEIADARSKVVPNSTSTENLSPHTNIILTSESSDVLQAQKRFQESNSLPTNLSLPFKFVTNDFDVLQNTGNPSKMSTSESSKEEILISALASLKMQLHARYSVGNCCSNHHLLLFDFLKEGCGASDFGHVANCMQDHEDERFRICCGWTKTEECLARRKRREALQSQMKAPADFHSTNSTANTK